MSNLGGKVNRMYRFPRQNNGLNRKEEFFFKLHELAVNYKSETVENAQKNIFNYANWFKWKKLCKLMNTIAMAKYYNFWRIKSAVEC